MSDRWGILGQQSIGHGGKVGVLHRIWRVFMGGAPFARTVKHVTLVTWAPHFAAMADRLLSQSAPAINYDGKAGVLPRIWHVFMGGRHARER